MFATYISISYNTLRSSNSFVMRKSSLLASANFFTCFTYVSTSSQKTPACGPALSSSHTYVTKCVIERERDTQIGRQIYNT